MNKEDTKTHEFESVKFHYFPVGPGWCTAAFRLSKNKDGKGRLVKVGISYCHPKDQFSKVDRKVTEVQLVNKDGVPTKPNRENWNTLRKVVLVKKIIEGGRTRSLDRLENDPVEIIVSSNGNPVKNALGAIRAIAFDSAPSWRDKIFVTKNKNGGIKILGYESVVNVADPNEDSYMTAIDFDSEDKGKFNLL